MVERFLRDIADKRIRRDTFNSVAGLEMAIKLHVQQHNEDPKPFIWTASASDILAKVTRAKAALALPVSRLPNARRCATSVAMASRIRWSRCGSCRA